MREKLNESKAAQVGLLAVLAIGAAVLLLGKGGGSESSEAIAAPVSTEAEAPAPVEPGGTAGVPTTAPPVKGPPKRFTKAYHAGKTVALLVVHNGGIDDRYTKLALKEVALAGDVTPFIVPAKQISRYATVTVGLNVNQVPALIVLRPRKLSPGTAQASVLYGYQTPESVSLAVREATYHGPEKSTYHPD